MIGERLTFMQDETVLVTGVTGFIAFHCALQLLDRGYRVRGTVRSPAKRRELDDVLERNGRRPDEVETVVADLTKDEGWSEAVKGCRYVLHVASPFPATLPKSDDDLLIPARDGALRVLKAAREEGVKRVVLTSSIAAVCYGHKRSITRPMTEEDWTDLSGSDTTPYIRSKTIAERAAWAFMAERGGDMELTTVLPGLVFGPALGKDTGTSLDVIRQMMAGKLPRAPRLGWPIVDVRDVAAAHVTAMETPKAAGERFLCSNDFIWVADIADILRRNFPAHAKRLPKGELPDWLVRVVAKFDKGIASVAFELGYRKEVSRDKAKRLLNWHPRGNEEAVVSAAQSLIERGIV